MENKAHFESPNGNYEVVCLYKRENIDLANLTEDEFVKLMTEDLATAFSNYKEFLKEPVENSKKSYIENVQKNAIKYAESRWKRESKRNEYVASEIEKASNDNYFDTEIYNISFTIKPNKLRLETPVVCCLHKKTDENQLRACFQKIKDDKYFRHGSGWAFRYETNSKKFPKYSFIPSVDIILDEEFSKLQKADEKTLERAIDNFYKDIKYKGD